ncbi:conserved hypothetical protein [Trichinella spiralis]|uniref:hypothetical protein n=1 Tax=Trichinella spiralis TaxID=6334 RepID=UPI0001EFD788|nr:conserved hypothetical protein [Trichinella spiralis]
MYLSQLTITAFALLSTLVLIRLLLSAVSHEQLGGVSVFRRGWRVHLGFRIVPLVTAIRDNKEKLQLRNRITCLSERATDNHGEKSHCGRPRTEHHAPTLHDRLPLL